jgi:hypothetical protein
MKCDRPRARFDIGSRFARGGQPAESNPPKGGDMLITETTILTSMTADTGAKLQEIASRAAVTLVLGATTSLTQATLTSDVHPNGAARSTIRGLESERAGATVTVTTLSDDPGGTGRKRVLVSALIVVTAESVSCSQTLTSALLASVPNRVIKPTVVVRSPKSEQPTVQTAGSGWREILGWKRARP